MTRSVRTFDYHRPTSLREASSILLESGPRAALLAGGTDLLVRLKRVQRVLDVVVDLGGLPELAAVEERVDGLWIGAMAPTADVAGHVAVKERFPAVADAARQVGGIQIRNMATVGGAVCGGLRCQFRDQSEFWRKTLGACLADGGEGCHARPGASCVATVACDLPPALAVHGGRLEIHGPDGERTPAVDRLYSGDGTAHLTLEPGEIVAGVLLPWSEGAPRWTGGYTKTRLRKALDRPLLGLAANMRLTDNKEIAELRIALCGNGPAVGFVPGLEAFQGARLDSSVAEAVARAVTRWFLPSPAVRVDVAWRRIMAGVMARQTLGKLTAKATRRGRTRPQADTIENQRS